MAIQPMQFSTWNDTGNITNPLSNALSQGLATYSGIQKASLPFGGASLTGEAGKVMGLEMLKQRYGENSPQYKTAFDAFNLEQKSTGSRINYQDKLANSLPLRYTTPEGKSFIEQSNVNQGYSPAGTPIGQPVVPGMPNYNPGAPQTPQGNQYDLKRLNTNIPASVKQKNLYAANIKKTLDQIDPEDIVRYSGFSNIAELANQKLLDAIGQSSPEYKKHKDALNALEFLGSQATQFYGDSIQPSELERKMKRFNSTGAFVSPETAKGIFNKSREILNSELKTYNDATKSTDIYHGDQKAEAPEEFPEGKVQEVKTIDGKRVIKINGKWYHP